MTNDLFHIIEEAQIILRSKGTFYQKKVYRRGNRLYAAWGSGFIRIGGQTATSNPNVSWETIDMPKGVTLGKDSIGNPTIILLAEVKAAA